MRRLIATTAVLAIAALQGCQPPAVTRVYRVPDATQMPWVVRHILEEQQRQTGVKGSAKFEGNTVAVTTTEAGQAQIESAFADFEAAIEKASQ